MRQCCFFLVLNSLLFYIYLGHALKLCGHNPVYTVYRRVQKPGRWQKSVGRGGIQSGIGAPYRNVWVIAPTD